MRMSRNRVGSSSVNASGIRDRKDRLASSQAPRRAATRRRSSVAACRLPCTTTLRHRKSPSISSTSKATGQESLKLALASSKRVPRAVRPHSAWPETRSGGMMSTRLARCEGDPAAALRVRRDSHSVRVGAGTADIQPSIGPCSCRSGVLEDHLQGSLTGSVRERFVRLHRLAEREAMGHEPQRLQPAAQGHLQQHRRGHGVHQPGRERDVVGPELLQVQARRTFRGRRRWRCVHPGPRCPGTRRRSRALPRPRWPRRRPRHRSGPRTARHRLAVGAADGLRGPRGTSRPAGGSRRRSIITISLGEIELRRSSGRRGRSGPAPTMATVSPGLTCPLRTPHSKPVGRMSLSMASASSSAPGGQHDRGWCRRGGSRTYSAWVPSIRLPRIQPPSSAVRVHALLAERGTSRTT